MSWAWRSQRATWHQAKGGQGTVGVSVILRCTRACAKVHLGPHSEISDPKTAVLLQYLCVPPAIGRNVAMN